MPCIFISYRRDDTSGYSGRLHEKLSDRFGTDQIFMDIDTLKPGSDFINEIETAVNSCDVLIALIGSLWLSIEDSNGQRRLDDLNDIVRLEIASALKRGIFVIPVLIESTSMPKLEELPDNLKSLTRRHALRLSNISFNQELKKLIESIEDKTGLTSVSSSQIENIEFISQRKKTWAEFSKDQVWIVLGITPDNAKERRIDVEDEKILHALNNISLPEDFSFNPKVNIYRTNLNEFGVMNEDFRELKKGNGHRIQIFKNGHCEFLVCLEGSIKQFTQAFYSANKGQSQSTRIIRYTHLAHGFICQVNGLKQIWDAGLPFNRMSLTAMITNTSSTRLFSKTRPSIIDEDVLGSPISSNSLEETIEVEKSDDFEWILYSIMKPIINSFGLSISGFMDENGQLCLPEFLHS